VTLDQALLAVDQEVGSAMAKHPKGFNSSHEGWAVIWEELDEMWDEVRANNLEASKREAIQVAAMAVRYLMDL
jgi:hypothetical protein